MECSLSTWLLWQPSTHQCLDPALYARRNGIRHPNFFSQNLILAASINLLILNLATLASSIVAMQLYGNGENINRDIYMLMTAMFIIQLMFLLIGSFSAAISKNPGGSAPKSAALLFFTFLISTAIDIDKNLEFLSYITPFKYFEAKDIMYGGSFNPVFLILSLALCSALLAGTYLFFNKRDLYL